MHTQAHNLQSERTYMQAAADISRQTHGVGTNHSPKLVWVKVSLSKSQTGEIECAKSQTGKLSLGKVRLENVRPKQAEIGLKSD